jgi:hypothetical protein
MTLALAALDKNISIVMERLVKANLVGVTMYAIGNQ